MIHILNHLQNKTNTFTLELNAVNEKKITNEAFFF